jgi:hypothetical protein
MNCPALNIPTALIIEVIIRLSNNNDNREMIILHFSYTYPTSHPTWRIIFFFHFFFHFFFNFVGDRMNKKEKRKKGLHAGPAQ